MSTSTRIVGPLARLSYPHLAEAQAAMTAGKPAKFSAAFVFTPELLAEPGEQAKYVALQQALVNAVKGKYGEKAEALLKSDGFKKGLRKDWEGKGYPEGSSFVTARSTTQPGLVYGHPDPETMRPAKVAQGDIKTVFYPGLVVRPLLSIFMFDMEGNKGVSLGLEGIQRIKDAPRMDNRVNAEDVFDIDLSQVPASIEDLM